ncbi:MAG: DUF2505 family protein [Sandaracinaceae bacterium]|nr:DUF2505 family protein [Sandaracinaceae bacterium]
MNFEIKHTFDAPRAKIEEALLSSDYLQFVLENHGVLLEVEVKERTENEREVRRKVRYRPQPVIKSIGPKNVPPEWFAFVEDSTFSKSTRTFTFKNIPTSGKIDRMLINRGTITLRELGPNRTERVVAGELKLDLPFMLKPLAMIGERVIHGEAVKLLDGEAVVMNKWLAKDK